MVFKCKIHHHLHNEMEYTRLSSISDWDFLKLFENSNELCKYSLTGSTDEILKLQKSILPSICLNCPKWNVSSNFLLNKLIFLTLFQELFTMLRKKMWVSYYVLFIDMNFCIIVWMNSELFCYEMQNLYQVLVLYYIVCSFEIKAPASPV